MARLVTVEWELWGRLALSGVATRAEIEGTWSLADLYLAHLVLDYHEGARAVVESGKE